MPHQRSAICPNEQPSASTHDRPWPQQLVAGLSLLCVPDIENQGSGVSDLERRARISAAAMQIRKPTMIAIDAMD